MVVERVVRQFEAPREAGSRIRLSRRGEALGEFLAGFSDEEKAGVRSIAMDMWAAYISAAKTRIPDAERRIVFDKFHIPQHTSTAVDKVRPQEAKILTRVEDGRLKNIMCLWLRNPSKLQGTQRAVLQALKASSLKTARAQAIKEIQ